MKSRKKLWEETQVRALVEEAKYEQLTEIPTKNLKDKDVEENGIRKGNDEKISL